MRLDFGQPDDQFAPTVANSDAATPSERAEVAARLAAWVERSGGSASGVRVTVESDASRGIGLVAAQTARVGDELLSVPLSLGLSAERALSSSMGTHLMEFDPYLADYAFIALALLHERRLGDDSDLAPWLSGCASLMPPSGFGDLPLLWEGGAEALADLESATVAGAQERLDDLNEDFKWLEENVFSAEPTIFPPFVFTYDAYKAAVAVAISRSVAVVDADGEARPMLLPLLDLVNHDGGSPTAVLATKQAKAQGLFGGGAASPACATLAVSSEARGAGVDAGGALCMRYGGSTSGELLLDHGFLDEPVAPLAPLTFAIDDDDTYLDEKVDCLEQVGLAADATWLVGEPDAAGEAIPSETLAFLRLKHMSNADAFLLEPVFLDSLWREHLQLPVSEDNERAALEDLKTSAAAALGRLGASVQADLQTLAEADKASREFAFASVRYAERRALQAVSRAVDNALDGLKGLEYYQDRRLASLGLTPIETDEELEALKAAGRSISATDYDW